MLFCGLGALLALVLLARVQDREIARVSAAKQQVP
jgi:hypothetical protein